MGRAPLVAAISSTASEKASEAKARHLSMAETMPLNCRTGSLVELAPWRVVEHRGGRGLWRGVLRTRPKRVWWWWASRRVPKRAGAEFVCI